MSSFRPLIEREAPRFIPLPRLGVPLSGGGTDALDAAFSSVAQPDEPANFDAMETAESVMRVEADAERIAAIEAEAYERGRSEARLEADRLDSFGETVVILTAPEALRVVLDARSGADEDESAHHFGSMNRKVERLTASEGVADPDCRTVGCGEGVGTGDEVERLFVATAMAGKIHAEHLEIVVEVEDLP